MRSRPSGFSTRCRIPKQRTTSKRSSVSGQLERVAAHVLDARVQQLRDRAEARAGLELDPPARPDPVDVLLAVDGHDPLGAAVLGQEGVEAVERPDVEHALPGERLGQERHPVAVVARDAGRVQAVLGVEREGVEPQRHLPEHALGVLDLRADRQRVGDRALGIGELRDLRERLGAQSVTPCPEPKPAFCGGSAPSASEPARWEVPTDSASRGSRTGRSRR